MSMAAVTWLDVKCGLAMFNCDGVPMWLNGIAMSHVWWTSVCLCWSASAI